MTARERLVRLLVDADPGLLDSLYGTQEPTQVAGLIRGEVLREAQDATVAWLHKKAGEEHAAARQEEERRATARARRERADLIAVLASKADRGAIREFLDSAPPRPTRADVLREAADELEESAIGETLAFAAARLRRMADAAERGEGRA